MNRIQIFLSNRLTGILFTLTSILAINSLQQVLENFGWDNSFSIAGAKNISEGHGYSVKTVSPEDFSKVLYEPIDKWPPGYSWLLIFVHAITATDWIRAAYILNAIGLTLLVLVFRRMLFQLFYPSWIVNISVFYFGFVFHYFFGIYFSDIFSLLFFMAGCSFLLGYLQSGKNPFYLVLISSVLFSFSAGLKYLYFGLAFVPLLVLFCFGYKIRKKKIKWAAIKGLSIIVFCIGFLILYQYGNSGKPMYIKPSVRMGFYPNQLFLLTPIIPGSFLNLNFLNVQISEHARITYENLNTIWSIINFGCSIWLLYICWFAIRKKNLFQNDSIRFYALLSISVTIYIFIFLGSLSLFLNKYYADMHPWVHIQEARYFAPFCILILQFAIFLFLKPSVFLGKTASLIFKLLMVFIITEEIVHSSYFIIKQIFVKKEFGLSRVSEQYVLQSLRLTQLALKKNDHVVVCSDDAEIPNMCSLTGSSAVFDLKALQKLPPSSEPLLLISIVSQISKASLGSNLFRMDTKLVCEQNGYFYYFTNVSGEEKNETFP
jgi:hypothetical protein